VSARRPGLPELREQHYPTDADRGHG
jgi:hypothetical protein